jgi:hypothetical protein
MYSTLGYAPGLTHKYYTRLLRPARGKYSSLFQTVIRSLKHSALLTVEQQFNALINNRNKKVYNIAPF